VATLILITLGIIFYLDNSPRYNTFSQNKLAGYEEIRKQILILNREPSLISNNNYAKFIESLNQLEDTKLSREEKVNKLQNARADLISAYFDTNNNSLYLLQNNLNKFIESNFQELGNLENPQCFDEKCAKNPQPKEILDVIDEIKNSSLPQDIKDEDIKYLLNYGYINQEHNYAKAIDYLSMAENIRYSRDYTEAGINLTIYNKIVNYVKNAFPEEYEKINTESVNR
jgi:hypothetical protein